ncbi:MAG: hypothetical protein ACRDOB_06635 [Streptosporangiaceae bacterium]
MAFVTKLLYFAGYRLRQERRPLVYDSLVPAAIPGCPRPHCSREWALFNLGGKIRDALRA